MTDNTGRTLVPEGKHRKSLQQRSYEADNVFQDELGPHFLLNKYQNPNRAAI